MSLLPHRHTLPETAEPDAVERGEHVAFAVESVATCFATDFIDPVISHLFQKQHAHAHGHHEHGNLWQNVVGEVGGDIFSAVALIGAEELAPRQMRALGEGIGQALDPIYRSMARNTLDIDPDKPEDKEQYLKWRAYQQDNLARTIVMSVAGVGGNVALQKSPLLGNPSPATVIVKGKIAGAGITAALVLGSRLAFPETTKKIDNWLSRHCFAPLLRATDRWRGKTTADAPEITPSWAGRVQGEDGQAAMEVGR